MNKASKKALPVAITPCFYRLLNWQHKNSIFFRLYAFLCVFITKTYGITQNMQKLYS